MDRDDQAIEKFAAQNSGSEVFTPTLISICIADVEAKPIEWLWPGKIALGKVCMIAGDPGLGKSLVTLDMASTVSKGGRWPVDGSRAPLGDVLLLTVEDDIADTIRPRLDAAGADVRRVHAISMIRDRDSHGQPTVRSVSIKRDLVLLAEKLLTLPHCKLIVIDPISAYLDGTDSHNNAEVRGALAPLADLASKHNVAVVCVTHLNKGATGSAMYRTVGSIGFTALARCVFAVAKDLENSNRRLVIPVKNNLGNDQFGLAYEIHVSELNAPYVVWEPEAITISADDALTNNRDDETLERSAAAGFLKDLLSAGPMTAKEIRRSADDAGHAWRTVQRARIKLGIEPRRTGYGPGSKYIWDLPCMPSNAMYATPQDVARIDSSGTHVEIEVVV
jgi:putative DNA primase/helicase